MLRRIELEALATVDRGDTISELAMKLDHSESYLSRAVADLVEKRLVYTERDGRRKRVVPSDARAVERYQDLVRQHSHIEFPELLTGKALEVLYYLDQPRTVSEIADRSDNYRNTVNRVLKRFRDRGLVGTDDGRYDFNADFDRLHELARELTHHLHRQRLESVASKGTILWEDYDEFLAQAETEIEAEGFHETGLARFAAFDLQFLLTGHRYYFYSEELDEVSPAELCCHTLLIDDGSRHRSYCLLLLSHVDADEEDLRAQAATYGLEDEIDAMLRYFETHGKVDDDRLPERDEFQKLAADYGV
ncbi:helix-turn-helix domain-containing protein [Halorubrum sp. GN11GM_10-3_MGM]|uniref:MarR family transcriptional regulator n=1 Tax=Halorubrum sp. GN11GM_10-3_MGM TaxID=2518111 RepID=UPI0010F5050C|nr:MarR family transcriptional regulator [Halorubrum sp. GN11GM_10-3_MGM]TKX72376.1 MarR family transcriptional regulator [Halorubrum sp. GN11GM_10-3_MGM]